MAATNEMESIVTKSLRANSRTAASEKADGLEQLTEVTKTCEGILPPKIEEPGKRTPKSGTKTTKADLIVKRLRSKRGVSLDELAKITGWQPHSVRGFLSGTVRKRLELTLDVEITKSGIRRYRIVEDAGTAIVSGPKR